MMTDNRDPFLESLFDEAESEFEGELFTAQAMAQSQKFKYRLLAAGAGVVLLFALSAWLLAIPVQEFALIFTEFFGTALFDLGDSSAAWILSPVNNIASLLVLLLKLMRMGWKRITGVSYAY